MIEPLAMPDVRLRMLDYMSSPSGHHTWEVVARNFGFIGRKVSDEQVARFHRHEMDRWIDGELFYVTADMAHLAASAATQMPGFELRPEDLPAPAGCIYFQQPVGISRQVMADGERPPLPIVACTWGPFVVEEPGRTRSGVWVSYYTETDTVRREAAAFYADQPAERDRLDAVYRASGPLIYDDEAIYVFGSGEDTGDKTDGNNHKRERARMLRCAWLLMQQRVGSVETVRPTRSTRRRVERASLPAKDVRVIKLRSAHGAPARDGHGAREYAHRWIVRGHWRNQWYPSQERHLPLWISPHVKGPEDAPMIGGEKVYVWER